MWLFPTVISQGRGQKVGLDLQGRTTALPCLDLEPSTSPFLCKGFGGCWEGSWEQALYIPLREAQRHRVLRMLVFTHPWVFHLHPESPRPTSRRLFPRPPPTGTSQGSGLRAALSKFQFFFTFISVPKRKDHPTVVSTALVMGLAVFLSSEHSFFTGHSHVLIPSFFL